jgi:hypothetical protein
MFDMGMTKDAGVLDEYVNPVVIVIFGELRRNIAFNIVMFGVVIYGMISLMMEDEYVYAVGWVLIGLGCLQKIFYFFLDQFFCMILCFSVYRNFRDGYYYYGLGGLLLLWYSVGWLIKYSYPRFKGRMNRVVEDPYEWTEL